MATPEEKIQNSKRRNNTQDGYQASSHLNREMVAMTESFCVVLTKVSDILMCDCPIGSGAEVGPWAQCLSAPIHGALGAGEREMGRDTGYLEGSVPVLGCAVPKLRVQMVCR